MSIRECTPEEKAYYLEQGKTAKAFYGIVISRDGSWRELDPQELHQLSDKNNLNKFGKSE